MYTRVIRSDGEIAPVVGLGATFIGCCDPSVPERAMSSVAIVIVLEFIGVVTG